MYNEISSSIGKITETVRTDNEKMQHWGRLVNKTKLNCNSIVKNLCEFRRFNWLLEKIHNLSTTVIKQ